METENGNYETSWGHRCPVAMQYEKAIFQFKIPSEVQKDYKVISGAYRHFPFWNMSKGA